jgi:excisionase family DNA binding protein
MLVTACSQGGIGGAKVTLEKLYSVDEAAEALGISHWTIWSKLKNGELLRSKIGGRTVIRESALRALVVDRPQKKAIQSGKSAKAEAR